MPVRTPEEFDDTLDAEFGWRRAEIRRMRMQIVSSSGPLQETLLRAATALLYAHWEGFVKQACEMYVEYVGRRRLRFRHLRDCLAAVSARRLLRKGAQGDVEELIEAYRTVADRETRPHIRAADFVDTGGNLDFQSLERILKGLGVETEDYRSKAQLLDRRLLASRNRIAHGRYEVQGLDAYLELQEHVEDLMSLLRNQLSNAVNTEEYRSPSA